MGAGAQDAGIDVAAIRAYYLAAGAGGAYDGRILDPAKNGLVPWKTVP